MSVVKANAKYCLGINNVEILQIITFNLLRSYMPEIYLSVVREMVHRASISKA